MSHVSLPGMAWDACLKMTAVSLDLLTTDQKDIYLMIEERICGGISTIIHRCAKANNSQSDDFDMNRLDVSGCE